MYLEDLTYTIQESHGNLNGWERTQGISQQVQRINRPEAIRTPKDAGTEREFPIFEHPTNGLGAMGLELDYLIYVNNSVDLTKLLNLYTNLEPGERGALQTYIISMKGQSFPIENIIPAETKLNGLYTYAQMVTMGYITPEEIF